MQPGGYTGYYEGVNWNNGSSSYQVATYQIITGYLYVKNYGGAENTVNIPDNPNWNQVVISNINVTNGYAEIGIWNQATQDASIAFDDVEFSY